MQQKQRPTAKNAKLTFGVRRTELNTVPLHPGTDTPELGARVDCESSILDAARTKQAHSQPLNYLPPQTSSRSPFPFNPDCSRSQVAAGDFVALDAWHINMLSRLPDCSVVLGWVRSNSGWGRVTAGRGGGLSDTMCAYRKFECSCCPHTLHSGSV